MERLSAVGTEETDSVIPTFALLSLLLLRLLAEAVVAAMRSSAMSKEAREGLPLGRFTGGTAFSGVIWTAGCTARLDELARVMRPLPFSEPPKEAIGRSQYANR